MKIGEASRISGVSERMIRHYEKIGLIPSPARRDSGYRDYSDADVHRLRFAANARDLGFPIEEIRFLDKREATLAFGTNHAEGALLILTRQR